MFVCYLNETRHVVCIVNKLTFYIYNATFISCHLTNMLQQHTRTRLFRFHIVFDPGKNHKVVCSASRRDLEVRPHSPAVSCNI